MPSRIFDVFIMTLIIVNVVFVLAETFENLPLILRQISGPLEVISVIIFTIEYFLRIWTADIQYPGLGPVKSRVKYIFSFMAIVDLLAILPFYLPYMFKTDLRVLRMIRLFRLVRILKINRYTTALSTVASVIKRKSHQLISSLIVVFSLMIIASILMYGLEHDAQPELFQNAFSGLWWAIATLTTVGYGDIYPITGLGKLLSAIIALLGIGLVAVPTGIISAGFMEQIDDEDHESHPVIEDGEDNKNVNCKTADNTETLSPEKLYCPYCGEKLD